MRLVDLLAINEDRLPRESTQAMRYIEGLWQERGCPAELSSLESFLDKALEMCTRVQFRYPRVALLRLKQLQRGEWKPPGKGPASRLEGGRIPH